MIKPIKSIEDFPESNSNDSSKQWRLKLDKNENIYPVSNLIISTIKTMDFNELAYYPNEEILIDKLANYYDILKSEIMLSSGTQDALKTILETYIDKEDEILSYNPISNSLCSVIKHRYNLKLVQYSEKFKFNVNDIKNSITNKTKIFYCSTPDRNTGELIRASFIETLIQEYQDILFIIDCTYLNYSNDASIQDFLDLIKRYENIIIIKSFSKDYALAGLKIGFMAANKNIINYCKNFLSHDVNQIAINCASVALNDKKYLQEIQNLNSDARTLLYNGLIEKGFKPYYSESNFILCDFSDYCDFYYEKFKKNEVIVKRYPDNSPLNSCLRITVPKTGGVKFLLELLNKKDMLIFNPDGIIFDIRESYNKALVETYKYFSGFEIELSKINEIKHLCKFNCDKDAIKYILEEQYINKDINVINEVFQNIYFSKETKNSKFLIDKEELLISKETFEELSKKYDMVIYTNRTREEINYSLAKYNIDKFFYYCVSYDDLNKESLKLNLDGVFKILKSCPCKTIKYLGCSVDDIITGNSANIDTIGIISPGADKNSMLNNFKHLGTSSVLEDINNILNFLM